MAILSSDQVKMTSILEKAIAIIAPHRCVCCGNYNNILCVGIYGLPRPAYAVCVFCARPTVDWQVCAMCSPLAGLTYLWPFAEYSGVIEEVIKRYKFAHARAAARPLAACISVALPYLPTEWVIAWIPTAAPRVRQRGYDQARLLANEVARLRQLECVDLLARQSNARQVGASREVRHAQARQFFGVTQQVRGKRILLIDDVCTTGATLAAAANSLRHAGAVEVVAAVIAWRR